jgi:AraC family transcriptional regulator
MDHYQKGIITHKEPGILKKDGIYFYNPSDFAQEHLFYPHWGAEYVCTTPYYVDRSEQDVFDTFILFYVVKGNLLFRYRGKEFTSVGGDIVLLDCKYPNYYRAESEVQFRWIHFTGNASQAYCDLLYTRQQGHFSYHPDLGVYFSNLLRGVKTDNTNEHYFSLQLHTILSGLSSQSNTNRLMHSAVHSAKNYMELHFAEPLTIADISAVVNLSQYHFSRLFRSETGLSLHGYLLDLRMNHAKELLSETNTSVEEVAQQCGFSSTSHFIRAFKHEMNITPARFRGLFR